MRHISNLFLFAKTFPFAFRLAIFLCVTKLSGSLLRKTLYIPDCITGQTFIILFDFLSGCLGISDHKTK